MNEWIVFAIAVVAHELGHYVFDWVYIRKRPKISFNLIALSIHDDPEIYTIKTKALNHLIGVIAGLIPLMILNVSDLLMFVYLLISSMDLTAVYALTQVRKQEKLSWGTKIADLPCIRCKKSKEEIEILKGKIKIYKSRIKEQENKNEHLENNEGQTAQEVEGSLDTGGCVPFDRVANQIQR